MYSIFIVEDDKKLRSELVTLLSRYGYACRHTDDFGNMTEEILRADCDLVLLDLNLPYLDGFHICRELRKRSGVPVIVVTSRDGDVDELMSIQLGADDFITKPYNTQILLARIESLLKRSYEQEGDGETRCGDVILYPDKCIVVCRGKQAELTGNEQKILSLLMKRAGTVVSRDDIMQRLWQSDEFIDDNTLTVNIARLRAKLAGIGLDDFLHTKRGRGYWV